MNNNLKNIFGASLSALAFSLFSTSAGATCAVPPDCNTLGFTQTSGDCAGKTMLKCPFNQSQVYCPSSKESEKAYFLGDTYIKDGIPIGKVIDLNGMLATTGSYRGKPDQAVAGCEALKLGGLAWYLPDAKQYYAIWLLSNEWTASVYGRYNNTYNCSSFLSSCFPYGSSDTHVYDYHCVAAF